MIRITSHTAVEPVGAALHMIPPRIRRLLHFDVVTEDPVFLGLHRFIGIGDGRSYRNEAHVAYPCHQIAPGVTTIVLQRPRTVEVVVHEIGHVLDEALGFAHPATPITRYAETDRYEAFAESFTRWIVGPSYTPWMPDQRERDAQSVALFEELSR